MKTSHILMCSSTLLYGLGIGTQNIWVCAKKTQTIWVSFWVNVKFGFWNPSFLSIVKNTQTVWVLAIG